MGPPRPRANKAGAAAMLSALGLVLVIEGLLPFASPARWRESMRRIGELRDGQLRFMGLAAVLLGLTLLLISSFTL